MRSHPVRPERPQHASARRPEPGGYPTSLRLFTAGHVRASSAEGAMSRLRAAGRVPVPLTLRWSWIWTVSSARFTATRISPPVTGTPTGADMTRSSPHKRTSPTSCTSGTTTARRPHNVALRAPTRRSERPALRRLHDCSGQHAGEQRSRSPCRPEDPARRRPGAASTAAGLPERSRRRAWPGGRCCPGRSCAFPARTLSRRRSFANRAAAQELIIALVHVGGGRKSEGASCQADLFVDRSPCGRR